MFSALLDPSVETSMEHLVQLLGREKLFFKQWFMYKKNIKDQCDHQGGTEQTREDLNQTNANSVIKKNYDGDLLKKFYG